MSQGPRERLIDAAIALVREKGVEGTGLAELLERGSSARRSLYQHFPGGKHELIDASTRVAGRWVGSAVRDLGEQMDSAAVLAEMFRMSAQSLSATGFRYGCPIAAAASAPADAAVVRTAADHAFGDWVEAFATLLVREGHETDAARSLARFVVSGIEGALLQARAARSTGPLEEAAAHLARLLEASGPRPVA